MLTQIIQQSFNRAYHTKFEATPPHVRDGGRQTYILAFFFVIPGRIEHTSGECTLSGTGDGTGPEPRLYGILPRTLRPTTNSCLDSICMSLCSTTISEHQAPIYKHDNSLFCVRTSHAFQHYKHPIQLREELIKTRSRQFYAIKLAVQCSSSDGSGGATRIRRCDYE
jgi:hypothetical protein